MKKITTFYSKIMGTSFKPNGQELLKALKPGDPLTLQREPENKFDKNAIAILNSKGDALGYVPKTTAINLSLDMDSGNQVVCHVSEITGGTTDKDNYGCNIHIEVFEA